MMEQTSEATEQRQTLGTPAELGGASQEPAYLAAEDPIVETAQSGEATESEAAKQLYGDARDELGTRVVKRKLKTNDVWHCLKVVGKIGKQAREQLLASEGRAENIDVMSLFLTEGVETAEAEINAWFSSLTGISAQQIDSGDIGLYMDILEDLDKVGIDGFLRRFVAWYRAKNFGQRPNSSPSE